MGVRVDAEGFKGGYEDEDGDPSVSEREGEVDEDCWRYKYEMDRGNLGLTLVGPATSLVIPAQDPIDTGDDRIDEQTKDKGPKVVTLSPKVYINGDEDSEDRESPTNTTNDDSIASISELVNEIIE